MCKCANVQIFVNDMIIKLSNYQIFKLRLLVIYNVRFIREEVDKA